MKRILLLLIPLLLISGCVNSVEDVKSEDYIGQTVILKGTVENTIKLGSLSGYTLVDDKGNSIPVSTENLPKEGDKVTISGVVMKDSLFGYYILLD
ncbi:MAG: hypothetical protein ABIJ18_01185 [archaeon]